MNLSLTHNAKELKAAFDKSPAVVTKQLQRWTDTSAALVERIAKQEVPVVQGLLQNSIFQTIRPLYASVQPNKEYMGWVHDGAKSPFAPRKLRNSSYRGNPFMARTYRDVKPTIDSNANHILDRIIRSI